MATTAEDSFNVFRPNLEPPEQAQVGGQATDSNVEMSQEETKQDSSAAEESKR